MRHLTDDENVTLLRDLNNIITDRVVIMDLSPGGRHGINTLLSRFNRGQFSCTTLGQLALIGRVMGVDWHGSIQSAQVSSDIR